MRLLPKLPAERLPKKQDWLPRLQERLRRRLLPRLLLRRRQKRRLGRVLLPRLPSVPPQNRLPVRLLPNRLQERRRLKDGLPS